jgi:hypothetical protein
MRASHGALSVEADATTTLRYLTHAVAIEIDASLPRACGCRCGRGARVHDELSHTNDGMLKPFYPCGRLFDNAVEGKETTSRQSIRRSAGLLLGWHEGRMRSEFAA